MGRDLTGDGSSLGWPEHWPDDLSWLCKQKPVHPVIHHIGRVEGFIFVVVLHMSTSELIASDKGTTYVVLDKRSCSSWPLDVGKHAKSSPGAPFIQPFIYSHITWISMYLVGVLGDGGWAMWHMDWCLYISSDIRATSKVITNWNACFVYTFLPPKDLLSQLTMHVFLTTNPFARCLPPLFFFGLSAW